MTFSGRSIRWVATDPSFIVWGIAGARAGIVRDFTRHAAGGLAASGRLSWLGHRLRTCVPQETAPDARRVKRCLAQNSVSVEGPKHKHKLTDSGSSSSAFSVSVVSAVEVFLPLVSVVAEAFSDRPLLPFFRQISRSLSGIPPHSSDSSPEIGSGVFSAHLGPTRTTGGGG